MDKILVFEAFSGYGSQSMALELLKQDIGLDYEVIGISEIEPNAIKAYYAARDARLDTKDVEIATLQTCRQFNRGVLPLLHLQKSFYKRNPDKPTINAFLI